MPGSTTTGGAENQFTHMGTEWRAYRRHLSDSRRAPEAFAEVEQEEVGKRAPLHEALERLARHLVQERVFGGDDIRGWGGVPDERRKREALPRLDDLLHLPIALEPDDALPHHVEPLGGRPATMEDDRPRRDEGNLERLAKQPSSGRIEAIEGRVLREEIEGLHRVLRDSRRGASGARHQGQ